MARTNTRKPATIQNVESFVRTLPRADVLALASLRLHPESPGDHNEPNYARAVKLLGMIQQSAIAVSKSLKGEPLDDEPRFNKRTAKTLEDARAGKGVVEYESMDDLFAALEE